MKKLFLIPTFLICSAVMAGGPVASPQCITEYKVTYEDNEVPNWDNAPKDFCSGPGQLAVPGAISVFPLSYKLKKQKNKDGSNTVEHDKTWFYVVWHCYSQCPTIKK